MLKSLQRIVQAVGRAADLDSCLNIVVKRVCETLNVEVCSVYLMDAQRDQLVLRANQGFGVDSGGIRIGLGEGLVGRVAKRKKLLNLADATEHPAFLEVPELDEVRMRAFMGVPLMHQRRVVGVLIVQHSQRRNFDNEEESFLLTLGAQLAALMSQAPRQRRKEGEKIVAGTVYRGRPAVSGIGIGVGIVITPPADLRMVPFRRCRDKQAEIVLLHQCVRRVRQDIKEIGARLGDQLASTDRALFDAYLKMLDNDALTGEIIQRIEKDEWVESAISRVVLKHVAAFEQMEDDYLSQRATDIMDLGRRLLGAVRGVEQRQRDWPEATVLIGEDLSVTALAQLPMEKLTGIVSARGSRNSHLALLARALGIPTIMGAQDLPVRELDMRQLVVDGRRGQVHLEPGAAMLAEFNEALEQRRILSEDLEALKDLPAQTVDGHRVELLVNAGLAPDISQSRASGAEGVGLYRTEVPFMMRERFPIEDEQRDIYRRVLTEFSPKSVTMRTLDIGGDKPLSYFPIKEENPFLGWRGIRVSLDHPELFRIQVRAMLRASEGLDNLQLMLPMIGNLEELTLAMDMIYEAHAELLEEEIKVPLPPIGVMIEVPAAVYQIREYALHVDFLSVGSNDLVQYLLAVDRNNARVADLFEVLHPAVLMALADIAREAHAEGKPVNICGELAGDPLICPLLVAMGYDGLSMGAASLPVVKGVLRKISMTDARQLLDEVMQLHRASEVRKKLAAGLSRMGLDEFLDMEELAA